MSIEWMKKRGYRHFDLPVNEGFALKIMSAERVSRHSFSPLIHYTKSERRYKKCPTTGNRSLVVKDRPIKYASHRDACILSYYAYQLSKLLDAHYRDAKLDHCVIAYRALGRANYHFAAEALSFAHEHSPVMILAFDITGFFDNLDHGLLKKRLKNILSVQEIPDDWYKVFRFITRFRFVDLSELKSNPTFGARLAEKSRDRLASIEELKAESITFHENPELLKGFKRGIPQGTPISSAASNLYMMEFDLAARDCCTEFNALYRRYSDDILVICKPEDANAIERSILSLIAAEKLVIASHKTEKTLFDLSRVLPRGSKAAQYLGFTFSESGAAIRESSLARQWRKLKRSVRRAQKSARWRAKVGLPGKVYRKSLFRRFSHLKVCDGDGIRTLRNFSSYARRSAAAFGEDTKILEQVKRLERAALQKFAKLK